ncbi:MAG: hypothetical protein GY906_22790 [bacterium]|nr:hypothetical protein [bacterium]
MAVPIEGPAEHIRNALQILVSNQDARKDPSVDVIPFLSDDDIDAIIERLKLALVTLEK